MIENDRRTFLTATGGTLGMFGLGVVDTSGTERRQTASLGGTVTNPFGEPISGATVVAYDATGTASDILEATSTDSEGRYSLSALSETGETLLTVTDDENGYFGVVVPNPSAAEDQDIQVENQFLFPTSPAAAPAVESRGMVSLWRWIDPTDALTQALIVEVTEVSSIPPGDQNLHRIDTGVLEPTETGQSESQPLMEGVFSFIVPETVQVDYDGNIKPKGVHLFDYPDKTAADSPGPMQQWHPARIGIPAYTLFNSIASEATKNPTGPNRMTAIETDTESEEDIDKILEILVGSAPVLGEIQTLYNLYNAAVGESQPEETAQVVAGTNVSVPDRNEYDVVAGPWDRTLGTDRLASSVALRVPIRLGTDADQYEMFVRAKWRMEEAWSLFGYPFTIQAPEASESFVDDFSHGSLDAYKIIAGTEDDWAIEEKIDGNSLRASRNEGKAFVVLNPDEHSWSGDRDVAVKITTQTANFKKNAYLLVGDGSDRWLARVGVQGNAVNLFYDAGADLNTETISKESVEVTAGDIHTLALRIRDDSLTLSLDGTDHITHTHSDTIGAGTVGVGTTGGIPHETWFDDLTVTPQN